MDAMWDNTIWTEIEEATYEDHEVDKITAVAGVRGAEAEDEALEHLYYRKTMKSISLLDLKKAYGILRNKRDDLKKINENHQKKEKALKKLDNFLQNHPKLKKLNFLISELETKIKKG